MSTMPGRLRRSALPMMLAAAATVPVVSATPAQAACAAHMVSGPQGSRGGPCETGATSQWTLVVTEGRAEVVIVCDGVETTYGPYSATHTTQSLACAETTGKVVSASRAATAVLVLT